MFKNSCFCSHCRGDTTSAFLHSCQASEPGASRWINLHYYPKWVIGNKSLLPSGVLVFSVECPSCQSLFPKSIGKQRWCGQRSLQRNIPFIKTVPMSMLGKWVWFTGDIFVFAFWHVSWFTHISKMRAGHRGTEAKGGERQFGRKFCLLMTQNTAASLKCI